MSIRRAITIALAALILSACQSVGTQVIRPSSLDQLELEKINRELSENERIAEYTLNSAAGVKFSYQLTANSDGDARFVIFVNGKDSIQSTLHFWFDDSCGMNQNAKLKLRNGREIENFYFDEFAKHTLPTNVSLIYQGKSNDLFNYLVTMGAIEKNISLTNKIKRLDLEVFHGHVILNKFKETI